MIHPPDVIGKYAPDAVIGVVGEAPAATSTTAPAVSAAAPVVPARKDVGHGHANHHAWGQVQGKAATNWRVDGYDDNPGVFILNIKSYFYAFLYLWMAIIIEVLKTIFCNKNFKLENDAKFGRVGLTRSAILLILFIVIHAVGNLHVFEGPDDFNGYGYFYVRLYWTGFGLPANIVEEYILLSAMLHVIVGLKRTWDNNLQRGNLWNGRLSLAVSGVVLLCFMTVHLFQFRFGATLPFLLRPPPYLIYFAGILQLQLFWTVDQDVKPVPVRDIFKLEVDRFVSGLDFFGVTIPNFWAAVYILCVFVFMFHACYGWEKCIKAPAMDIPKGHINRIKKIGYVIFWVLGVTYISFPLYVTLGLPTLESGAPYGEGMSANGDKLNSWNADLVLR